MKMSDDLALHKLDIHIQIKHEIGAHESQLIKAIPSISDNILKNVVEIVVVYEKCVVPPLSSHHSFYVVIHRKLLLISFNFKILALYFCFFLSFYFALLQFYTASPLTVYDNLKQEKGKE